MGLDISIYASRSIEEEEYSSFHDLSRSFCFLIQTIDEEKNELRQIANNEQLDIQLLQAMSSWNAWKLNYEVESSPERKQEIISTYHKACDQSWQDIGRVLQTFESLLQTLLKNPAFEERILYQADWLKTYAYFENIDQDLLFQNYPMHYNFGYDLRKAISFLKKAETQGMKLVRFQIS